MTRGAARSTPAPLAVPAHEPVMLVVWRRGSTVCHRRLGADEAPALVAVAEGARVAELCDLAACGRSDEEAADSVFSLLARWIGEELVTSE